MRDVDRGVGCSAGRRALACARSRWSSCGRSLSDCGGERKARAATGVDNAEPRAICDRAAARASVARMTDIASADFRHPRRHVRLDTILRLRWLAALGQLAAIFVVAQGLEFEFPVVPCLAIVGVFGAGQYGAADRRSIRCSGWNRSMRRRCWR